MGAAPAAGFARQTREASGHRPGDITIPVRGARWTGRRHHAFVPCLMARQPDEGNWRLGLAAIAGLRPDKRGPRSEIADKRSATGRAGSGSIHPRRILAQWMRISGYAPRGAPLPLVINRRRKAGGDFRCAVSREGANPSPLWGGAGVGVVKPSAALGSRVDRRCQSGHRSPSGTTPTPSPPHKGEGYRVALPEPLPRGEKGRSAAVAARGALRVFPRQPLGEGDADGGQDEGEVDHRHHRDDLDVFETQAAAQIRLQRMNA